MSNLCSQRSPHMRNGSGYGQHGAEHSLIMYTRHAEKYAIHNSIQHYREYRGTDLSCRDCLQPKNYFSLYWKSFYKLSVDSGFKICGGVFCFRYLIIKVEFLPWSFFSLKFQPHFGSPYFQPTFIQIAIVYLRFVNMTPDYSYKKKLYWIQKEKDDKDKK